MGGINFSVHPLFFAFGLYYALTGRIFVFVIYTISAVVHELGHSIVASNCGYRLNKITLMPFGAVVSGNLDNMHVKDEIKIAIAGPLTNLAIALFFVALWWIFPTLYAFTDIVAEANFSLALMNFLPIYPLDGGRVLSSSLSGALGRKKSFLICKIIGVVFSLILFALFIFSIFNTVNFSLLFFASFVLVGAVMKNKENVYVKLFQAVNIDSLKRGMEIKKIALHKSVTVKKLSSLLDPSYMSEIVVYDERPIKTLSQQEIGEIILNGELYAPLEKYI